MKRRGLFTLYLVALIMNHELNEENIQFSIKRNRKDYLKRFIRVSHIDDLVETSDSPEDVIIQVKIDNEGIFEKAQLYEKQFDLLNRDELKLLIALKGEKNTNDVEVEISDENKLNKIFRSIKILQVPVHMGSKNSTILIRNILVLYNFRFVTPGSSEWDVINVLIPTRQKMKLTAQ